MEVYLPNILIAQDYQNGFNNISIEVDVMAEF